MKATFFLIPLILIAWLNGAFCVGQTSKPVVTTQPELLDRTLSESLEREYRSELKSLHSQSAEQIQSQLDKVSEAQKRLDAQRRINQRNADDRDREKRALDDRVARARQYGKTWADTVKAIVEGQKESHDLEGPHTKRNSSNLKRKQELSTTKHKSTKELPPEKSLESSKEELRETVIQNLPGNLAIEASIHMK